MRQPIRSVLVLGGGPLAAMAALFFARSLPGVAVEAVETPVPPGAWTDQAPALLDPHAPPMSALGLGEAVLLAAGGVHRVGVRWRGWRRDGEVFVQAIGSGGLAGTVPVHPLWLQMRRADPTAIPYHRLLAGAALAEAERFAPPSPDLPFAYRIALHPQRLAGLLRALGARAGVRRREVSQAAWLRDGEGRAAGLRTAGGDVLHADLYVDAGGLRDEALAFEDWGAACLANRAMTCEAFAVPSPTAEAEAGDTGWTWRSPFGAGEWRAIAYHAATTSEAELRRAGPGLGPATPLRPGCRAEPWSGAVLAIGDAACSLPPLGDLAFPLAMRALELAMDLLPGRDMHPVETAEYNRRVRLQQEGARDMALLPLFAASRRRGGFWRAAAARTPPESLKRLRRLFGEKGRLPHREEDGFDPEAWLSLLLGLGVEPLHADPLATPLDPAMAEVLRARARDLAAFAGRLAPYGQPPGLSRTAGP